MNDTQTYTYPICLAFTAHQEATRQADRHDSQAKYQQVYRNVLARIAVNYYLQLLGVKTNWAQGDSNDLVWQSLFNISDLVTIDYGRIECIPVESNANYLEVAPETLEDRIAYVFVELEPHLRSANILGFVSEITQEVVFLNEVDSIELLPEYLEKHSTIDSKHRIELFKHRILETSTTKAIRLTQWLQEKFLNEDLGIWTPELEPAFRHVQTHSSIAVDDLPSVLEQFLLEKLQDCHNENSLLEYCQKLHKIAPKHPQVIASLVTIIETTLEETLRWNAALILGEIDPQHLMRAICCFKIVNIEDRELRLRLAIRQDRIDNYIILVGVYPVDLDSHPLDRLKLQVFDELNNLSIADSDINKGYLQVQVDGSKQEEFSIEIASELHKIREYFVI
jgi:hypothetical protein